MTALISPETTAPSDVSVRRFPYPYRAMLAICSDLDMTPDIGAYLCTARFLNTEQDTRIGPGVDLEVGNTIYFDMPPEQFSYWNTDDRGRDSLRALIRSGHIDCLHSFGDLALTRADAARSLEDLAKHGCRLEVWVDHAAVPTNFGSDIMQGRGDIPGDPAYHADLTRAAGVRYVWCGRVTSVTAQATDRRLSGIWNPRHPRRSGLTLLREAVKGWVGRARSSRYRSHFRNELIWSRRLRNSIDMFEFLRANPAWGGVSHDDTGDGIGRVLTKDVLNRLVRREGQMVLYTHLGKCGPRAGYLPFSAVDAFRTLGEYYRRGEILVTTTKRLLTYNRTMAALRISNRDSGNHELLDLEFLPPLCGGQGDGFDPQGLTVFCRRPQATKVSLNGRELRTICNPPDAEGRSSITIPWERLSFPEV